MPFHSRENPRDCRACFDPSKFKNMTNKANNKHNCPPNLMELGNCTWTFLHSTAAYYPDKPTMEQQESMKGLIRGLADFFPCEKCSNHIKNLISQENFRPDVASSDALSSWFCRVHNEVNKRLGKEMFDCSKVKERWKDGPKDNSCN